jgi:hypothetical protein
MPVAMDENGMWVGDGKGGMKRAEPTVTHIEIVLPGQNISINDENGIVIEKDQETKMLNIRAESIVINTEIKPKRSIFERIFKRKEG